MATVKVRVTKYKKLASLVATPFRKALLSVVIVGVLLAGATFIYFYSYYARLIADKLDAPFSDMTVVYAAPKAVTTGEAIETSDIAAYLRRAGYSEDSNRSSIGWYRLRPDAIEITPGPQGYDSEGAVIKVAKGKVTEIISQHDERRRNQFLLEPEPISNLFNKQREKRRIRRYEDIPTVMVDALLSAEDKNFFSHPGFDPFGILRAAYHDMTGDRLEGASTITQQLATTIGLADAKRDWRRKVAQTFITLHLEQRLTKKQIFEYYANTIDIGHQGSFWVRGFAQGAQVYFGKDLRQITLPEAALLAGLPQAPSDYDPFRHPDRATTRRNIVLKAMKDNGKITEEQMKEAQKAPLGVVPGASEASDAPYFVDLVTSNLRDKFPDRDFQSSANRIYTTLDMSLQQDLIEAIRVGLPETDKLWLAKNKKYGTPAFPKAQVAAIVLDTATGQVLAMQGGRSYGESQLNRALAMRQPGSSFKPVVYATAIATGLDPSGPRVLTAATTVVDEETTFWFDTQPPYEPHNHDGYHGTVTLRQALAHSYNIPAVKVAEMVGYDKVVDTARLLGLNHDIKATPAVALGSYEVTPLEIAGAYTVFPNQGKLLEPHAIRRIVSGKGEEIYQSKIEKKDAIDPRTAYVVTNMMQEVLRTGTGAGVSRYGFNLPAAGKTGTSRDAWFVGFTSRLICAVWVGFDDNRDFVLEGARSALPIWAEFMKRAHQHPEYSSVHQFEAPDGVTTVDIDSDTGELAGPGCPRVHSEVFISGTQPLQVCRLHNHGGQTVISSSWELPSSTTTTVADNDPPARDGAPRPTARSRKQKAPKVIPIEPASKAEPAKPAPKGVFGRILDLFH